MYIEERSTLSLHPYDNLGDNLLQLGTYHVYYTNNENWEDFLLTLYKVLEETAVRITADPCLTHATITGGFKHSELSHSAL